MFCCAHANAVCRHLADSRWITPEDTSYDTKAMLLDDASMKVCPDKGGTHTVFRPVVFP